MGGRRVVRLLLLLLFSGAFAPAPVRAQGSDAGTEPFRASWKLRMGLVSHGVSDGLASPMPLRGTGFLVGAGFGSPGHQGGWSLDASYWGPRVSSRIARDDGGFEDTHQVDLGFIWLRRVAEMAGGRVGLHLGVALDARFAFRTHTYHTWAWGSQQERFGDVFVPLQVAGMWSTPLGDAGLLTHQVSVPALTLAFRSPYTGLKFAPEASLEGPTSVTGFDSRLLYRTRTEGGWLLGVFHHLSLVTHPDPRPLSSVVHRLGVEVGR